jgi:hypothetical protein
MEIAAAAVMTAALFAVVPNASAARFHDPALQASAPSLVEDVACRTVRTRTVRPNGRVVYRTKRICTPGWHGGWNQGRCRLVRERIHRPNGSVVYRTVRRCR